MNSSDKRSLSVSLEFSKVYSPNNDIELQFIPRNKSVVNHRELAVIWRVFSLEQAFLLD